MERPLSPPAGTNGHLAESAYSRPDHRSGVIPLWSDVAHNEYRNGSSQQQWPAASSFRQTHDGHTTDAQREGGPESSTRSPGQHDSRDGGQAITEHAMKAQRARDGVQDAAEGSHAVPADLWPRRANANSRLQRPSQAAVSSRVNVNSLDALTKSTQISVAGPSRADLQASHTEQSEQDRSLEQRPASSESSQHLRQDPTRTHLSENASDSENMQHIMPLMLSASTSQGANESRDQQQGSGSGGKAERSSSSFMQEGAPPLPSQGEHGEQTQGVHLASQLDGFSRVRGGRRYKLVVVQHPERARMCGYGDKDRRPLSPSLIVKLVITDERTGNRISPWEVNTSLFFLASDLCDPDELMRAPRNLLLNTQLASIPASMLQETRPYETPRGENAAAAAAMSGNLNFASLHGTQQGTRGPGGERFGPGISGVLRDVPRAGPSASRMSALPPPPRSSTSGITTLSAAYEHQQQYLHQQQSREHRAQTATVTTEHYARNLVGAAVTSANVLRDERDEYQIFFVLQDLSVRAEGTYRIRLLFTDLGQREGQTNEGVSDALAETYTEPFSVYTPRRFPGMLEPTELSKKLASQGIKIAVRSDKKKRQRDAGEGEFGDTSGSGAVQGSRGIASGSFQGTTAADSGFGGSRGRLSGELEVDELDDDED